MDRSSTQRSFWLGLVPALLLASAVAFAATPSAIADDDDRSYSSRKAFQRIATYPVFLNNGPDDLPDDEVTAEIIAASDDGKLLIYTDSEKERVAFVDITDPRDPQPEGFVAVGGEPTSVAVRKGHALVAVNSSADFTSPSGDLLVIDLASRAIVRTIDLGGQPDSIAVSPDKRYAAIAIENERDEDLGDGRPPQAPGGFLVIVDLLGKPDNWSTREVSLDGVAELFPGDAEPEFVAINSRNIAAVTLQENNHVILVRLRNGRIIRDFSAGEVDLKTVDVLENDLIELTGALQDVPREPDAITALGRTRFATADEGDLDGGSRGFTIFDRRGNVRFSSGSRVERLAVRLGHYPEDRSENKGSEPEGIAFARYGHDDLLFVGLERANLVAVYELSGPQPKVRFRQALPAGIGPEGLLAIPQRNLFVVASEVDDPGGFRSSITIYKLVHGKPTYPTIRSVRPRGWRYGHDDNGLHGKRTPIPWGALSALAADPHDPDIAYTVHDSFYRQSRIFVIDAGRRPARIFDQIVLRNAAGETVDLDLEGLATRGDGGFWAVSEGRGSAPDPTSVNLLLRLNDDGRILEEIRLPAAVDALQVRFGLEGVTVTGEGGDELVYVVFQREWSGDPANRVRIGRYDPNTGSWAFFYYPIETPATTGWVGLSEIVALGDQTFAVIERDNQADTSAVIKRIYAFSIAGITPRPHGETFPVLEKTLVRDLIPDLTADNGPVLDKVEGLAVLANGEAIIVTDNDGVDDSSGETQFIRLGDIFGLGGRARR